MKIDLRRAIGFDDAPMGEGYSVAMASFWRIISESGLLVFTRGDLGRILTDRGILVGVAPAYNLYDLRLAECIIERVSIAKKLGIRLFDVLDRDDFATVERAFPSIRSLAQTPMIVRFEAGSALWMGCGFEGREYLKTCLECTS